MDKHSKNFSIIIPHKDIPDLLVRCIQSIPTRDDVEIIVVDDDSSDVDSYQERFPILTSENIAFISTKEGKGAGFARNIGLSQATGEWIIFADSDDIFLNEIAVILDELVQDNVNQIVYFDIESRDSITGELTEESHSYNNKIKLINEQGFDRTSNYSFLTPWAKAIRRDFIQQYNLRFEEVICSNDTAFSAYADFYAKSKRLIPLKGYCWMQRNGSLWRTRSITWFETRVEVSARLALFMRKNYDDYGFNLFRFYAESFAKESAGYSKMLHVRLLAKYCYISHDVRSFFVDLSRLVAYYIREKYAGH